MAKLNTTSQTSAELYVQSRASKSGSSFYYAFLFLPPRQRAAITAFYVFCREVDDVVDEVGDPTVAAAKLGWWRTEVKRMLEGKATHPVTVALTPYHEEFSITEQQLQGIIDGVETDLRQNRWLNYRALSQYCHLVAGLVGQVSCNIFGRTHDDTLLYADKLGLAFQLTNIIRDVGADARQGRIYLPQDEMREYGVKAADILNCKFSKEFQALMQFQGERALACYDEAFKLLPEEDKRAQRPGLMMASIYRQLLLEIKNDGYQVLDRHISLTPARKFWLAWRTWVFG